MSTLASPAPAPLLHVVLVAPEIPQNTGSIARSCAATATRLHLIQPLGFSLEDRYLKRAGLDYWPYVDLQVHATWSDLPLPTPPSRRLFFSARSQTSYLDAAYHPGDQLVFGRETRGLPAELLVGQEANTFVIPIVRPEVRSLNLSNAVSVVLYEALRQLGGPQLPK